MLKVGFGKRDITPPLGTPCALGLDNEAEEIFDPAYVRALVIKIGDDVFGLLAADVIGVYRSEILELRKLCAPVIGTSEDRIVIHGEHQHESPNIRVEQGEELAKYGLVSYSRAYYDFFRNQVVEAFDEAASGLFDAQVFCGESLVYEVASNRRMMNPNGTVYMRGSRDNEEARRYPEGHIDPLVRLVCFKSANSDREIILFNYSCHPSAAGGDEAPYIGGDFPGHACRTVESDIKNADTIFFQGTCGDINPGKYTVSSSRAEDVKCLGERLAKGVLEAHDKLRPMEIEAPVWKTELVNLPLREDFPDEATLQTQLEEDIEKYKEAKAQGKRMPGGGPILNRVCELLLARYSENHLIEAEIDTLALGNIEFVFLPGECFLETAERIRVEFPDSNVIVIAYCGYDVSYIPPPFAYQQGGYESNIAWVGPGAFDILVNTGIRLLKDQ